MSEKPINIGNILNDIYEEKAHPKIKSELQNRGLSDTYEIVNRFVIRPVDASQDSPTLIQSGNGVLEVTVETEQSGNLGTTRTIVCTPSDNFIPWYKPERSEDNTVSTTNFTLKGVSAGGDLEITGMGRTNVVGEMRSKNSLQIDAGEDFKHDIRIDEKGNPEFRLIYNK